MTPELIRNALSDLQTKASAAGLKVIATLIHRVFGQRSPEEHARWDEVTHQHAQDRIAEALAAGIHNPPDTEEVPPSELRSLEELPPLNGGTFADAAESTEVKALESVEAVVRDGRQLLVLDPQRLLSGFVRLLDDRSLWLAVEAQIRSKDLYDGIVAPIQQTLGRVTSHDALLALYCQASRLYGVRVRRVSAKQIYYNASAFVERAGSRTALTNSRTSGVIDPLERYGTEEILRTIRIANSHPLANRLRSKEAWRVVNFREGLLNATFDARRPYFFDRAATSESLRSSLEVLPDDVARGRYKDLAAENLLDAIKCRGVELFEVPHFELWMTRYTRSAPGHVLISLRHPATRAIDRGIELNFVDTERLHRFYSQVFRVVRGAATYGVPFAHLVMLAGELEDEIYYRIDRRLLRSKAENEMLSCAKRVYLTGDNDEQRAESARLYIDSLVEKSLGTYM